MRSFNMLFVLFEVAWSFIELMMISWGIWSISMFKDFYEGIMKRSKRFL